MSLFEQQGIWWLRGIVGASPHLGADAVRKHLSSESWVGCSVEIRQEKKKTREVLKLKSGKWCVFFFLVEVFVLTRGQDEARED